MTPIGAIYMEKIFQLYLIFVAVRCTWAVFHGVVKTCTNPLQRTRICVSVTEASNAKIRGRESNNYYMAICSDIQKSVLH